MFSFEQYSHPYPSETIDGRAETFDLSASRALGEAAFKDGLEEVLVVSATRLGDTLVLFRKV